MRRSFFTTILLLALATLATAQQPKEAKLRHRAGDAWTVDDVILGARGSDFRVSPDGRWAAWLKHVPDKDKDVVITQLMLSSLTEEREVQLTRGPHSASAPEWSSDGKLLAFLSSRPTPKNKAARDEEEDKDEPKTQVWLIDPFGGEPWVLTEAGRDVTQVAWLDADTLVYVAQEKPTLLEKKHKEKKDTSEVVDDEANEPPVRLWRIDLESKKVQRLTHNKDRIHSLAVAPDGRHAVTIHERSLSYTFDQKVGPAVFLHDLESGQQQQIFIDQPRHVSHVYWQLDSKGFYVVSPFTRHPRFLMAYVNHMYHYDLAGEVRKVELGWERGLADGSESVAITRDGFVALLADGVRYRLARYRREGSAWRRTLIDAEHVQALALGRDGRTLIFQDSSCRRPPRWRRSKLEGGWLGEPETIVDLASDLRDKPRAPVEMVQWRGARDEMVEGILYHPHAGKAGVKAPLIVAIHGGPFGADVDAWEERWAHLPNLLCARGAFVLSPNYHGSSNYGLDFAESIAAGKYYDLPVTDIERGIDELVRRGLVDGGKIGLTGWSNGAILTMALLTRRHYQAAAAGAGGSEWVGDWGACEFGMAFSNYYLGKSPIEDPELYRKNAPFFDFPKVRTPTLLFQGADDRIVPVHHGWMQFRALQQLGKTDVRFILFPGEKHSLKKLAHQRRKVEEELAWFDKYLFRSSKSDQPSLKEDSPLAVALARKQAARQGTRLGIVKNGVLVPETIAYQGLQLGRFEVTRAQFAEFDKSYRIEPGTDNYPAAGIGYAQARAYCTWLQKMTGSRYRLGRVSEVEDLYDTSTSGENTLDRWAGYTVNPEDLARLGETIRELGSSAPLLKEVGSAGRGGVFDLGGNVAEWAEETPERGRALGGSADRNADDQQPAAAVYIGVRVVLD